MNSDEDPEGITFFEFINNNYDQEKNKLKNLCGKFNTILFDEDIFHDTIIKVNDIIDCHHYSKDVYEKYMCSSFRTNLVREKLYHRNSMAEHTFNFEGIEPFTHPYVDSIIDLDIVINILNKKFGKGLTLFYIDWLSGYDIKEAMKKHNVNSGYYYIEKITSFIRGYNKDGKIIY